MNFILAFAALCSIATAHHTSIRLYMPDSGRTDGVYLSVINVQSDLTTVSIDCPYNSNEGPCWMDSKTITYAPSTMVYTHTYNGEKSDSIDYIWATTAECKMHKKKDSATCIYRVTSTRTKTQETRTFTLSWDDYKTDEFWATVTANAKELTAADTKITTTSDIPGATSTNVSDTSQATGTASSTASGLNAAETTTSSSSAAGASVTQSVMLMGAMAAIGGAGLLV